jgi:hypothetical protein
MLMKKLKDDIIYEILFGDDTELSFDVSELEASKISNFTDDIVEAVYKGSVEVTHDVLEVYEDKTLWNLKIIRK